MEKRDKKENFHYKCGRKGVIAGADVVTSIPLIRILDGIDVQVPAIVVPVGVHGPELCITYHPRVLLCKSMINLGTIYLRPKSTPIYYANSFFFLNIIIPSYAEMCSE